MTYLKEIVEDYLKPPQSDAEKEFEWFAKQTLKEAISMAALARTSANKRHGHQHRIPSAVLEDSKCRLLKEIERLKKATSFEELFNIVESVIGPIEGIGELAVYDTAHRIGVNLGLEPEKVYLHAGARVGARKLKLDSSKKCLEVHEFPKPLRELKPWQIEDVLCIYKEDLAEKKLLRSRNNRCCSNGSVTHRKSCS